jgi:hypothetical protein
MVRSAWDFCQVDPVVVSQLEELQNQLNHPSPAPPSSSSGNNTNVSAVSTDTQFDAPSSGSINKLQSLLDESDDSCRKTLEYLDSVLTTVHNVKASYYDVTGRTNNLMAKCEALLDQQVTSFPYDSIFYLRYLQLISTHYKIPLKSYKRHSSLFKTLKMLLIHLAFPMKHMKARLLMEATHQPYQQHLPFMEVSIVIWILDHLNFKKCS